MPQLKSQSEEQKHYHVWKPDGYAQDNCIAKDNGEKCKWIRVSQQEYDRRRSEWGNYQQMVKHSKSYQNFKWMQAAWLKERNLEKVKKIREVIASRCKPTGDDFYGEPQYKFQEDEYMQKPVGPDPEKYTFYQVTGAQI